MFHFFHSILPRFVQIQTAARAAGSDTSAAGGMIGGRSSASGFSHCGKKRKKIKHCGFIVNFLLVVVVVVVLVAAL